MIAHGTVHSSAEDFYYSFVTLFRQNRLQTSCGCEPLERRVARARRETASEAPKSAAGHGPAACRRQVAAEAVSRAVDTVRIRSWFAA
jgi:hypothetical protein